jgi:hypothetical protein
MTEQSPTDRDELTDAVMEAIMAHGLTAADQIPARVDYKRVTFVMIDILADLIAPQRETVRRQMLDEFDKLLANTVVDRALKNEMLVGIRKSVQ